MKAIRALAACLMLCLMLTACGNIAAEGSAKESVEAPEKANAPDGGSTLVIALQDEVEGLDVQQVGYSNMVHNLIFEPLVVYSPDLSEIWPSFAESYTATDEYLEFVLPADAKFCNGDALDAAAVKASVERFIKLSEYASDLEPVSSVSVVDERTVRLNLSEPAPYVWANLASMFGGIVDAAAAKQVGEWEFNSKPVGNGAYYVENWELGSRITLKRNEYFHTSNPMLQNKAAPPFDTIVVRFISDADERMSELKNGNVDVVYNAPTSQKAAFEADPDYIVHDYQQPGVCYLNLQTEKGILMNEKVRRALTYAIDRDAINEALGGAVTPAYGFLAAAQAGYSQEEEDKLARELAYNPELSRKLLAEAGWSDPDGDGIRNRSGTVLTIDMMIPSDRTNFRAAGDILRRQFAAIGVDAKILEYESDYIKERMRADEYDIGSRAIEWVDGDVLYYAFTGGSGYHWDDPELTELIVAARYVIDPQQRVEAYAAVSERLAQDFKAIPLFADNYIIVSRSSVKNIMVTADGRAWYNDAVKD